MPLLILDKLSIDAHQCTRLPTCLLVLLRLIAAFHIYAIYYCTSSAAITLAISAATLHDAIAHPLISFGVIGHQLISTMPSARPLILIS